MSLTRATNIEAMRNEGLRELEALGCTDPNVNGTLLDHFDQDVRKLFDALAPCRDCKAFVMRPAPTFQDRAVELKKVRSLCCSHGFTNTKHGLPPTCMCGWGFGYYLCCNCSLRDGWEGENYDAHGCGTCKQKKQGKAPRTGLQEGGWTPVAG